MARQGDGTRHEALAAREAPETLSQFTARVLAQLSLSAWLPSAALVLGSTYIVHLGNSLDSSPHGEWGPIGASFEAIGHTSIGGALLLFAAVVVLTIFTQAFSFEAIRMIEGYWGVKGPLRYVARAKARSYKAKANALTSLSAELTAEAWRSARVNIERLQADAVDRGSTTDLTSWSPDLLTWLGGQVTQQRTVVSLGPRDRDRAFRLQWRNYADPEPLRRLTIVDKRRRDFPAADRALPTKFGNILRAHEDQIRSKNVETFVLDVLHLLPAPLRHLHDDSRNRLDLYATMIFVELFVAAIALVRTLPDHWIYGTSISGGLMVVLWATYRAAMASARIYGTVLIQIATLYPEGSRDQHPVSAEVGP